MFIEVKWIFFKFKIFVKINPPHKVITSAPSNKSIMANKLPSTILERFLRRIKSPLTR